MGDFTPETRRGQFFLSATQCGTSSGPPAPTRKLGPFRSAALEGVLAQRAEHIEEGEDHAHRDWSSNPDALARFAEMALSEMRDDVRRRAGLSGPLLKFIAEGDRIWGSCDREEYLDDPELDPVLRTSIMSSLDELNGILDSYRWFFDELSPLLNPDGPTRVLDLAAGHGGFARAGALLARERGLDIHFTASDLKREYLDMGEALVAGQDLPVEFVVQDALNLSNLAEGAFDIITCTQSIHHFPPGLVAVMFEAATRAAARGVVFIDGCRSVLACAAITVFSALSKSHPAFVHDAFVSTRKFFVPQELELLARIARPTGQLESSWKPPGHCLLRWQP